MTDPAFTDVLEKRYFQFFRQKTVASTNSLMDSRFWDRIVLQICHVEPAVKHAVLALSSLHQLSEARTDTDLALRHQRYADQHYQRALSAAQGLLHSSTPEDIDRVLIACLVFICYENVRGNYHASQIHQGSGRAILAQHRDRLRRIARRNDLNEIQALFARLDVAAMAFSITNARYPYDMQSFFATNPNLIPDAFTTVEEARGPLIDHVRWCMVYGQGIYDAVLNNDPSLPVLEAELQKVCSNLQRWSIRFGEVVARDTSASPILIRALRIWHLLASAEAAANWYGSELRFDAFTADYDRLVTYAEEINTLLAETPERGTFSFDLGITICLFATVQRCRDPYTRRRALAAMRAGPKQEGTWGYPGAAKAVEQWMLFEEAGLEVVERASDIPEWRRIMNMDAAIDPELGIAELIFDVTPSVGHEEELRLGTLGVQRFDEGERVDAAVRPFSMGLGQSSRYMARFGFHLLNASGQVCGEGLAPSLGGMAVVDAGMVV